jgi:hypothetical protein
MSDLHFKRVPCRSNILCGVVEGVVPAKQQPGNGAEGYLGQFEGGILDADSHGKGITGPIEHAPSVGKWGCGGLRIHDVPFVLSLVLVGRAALLAMSEKGLRRSFVGIVQLIAEVFSCCRTRI